MKVLRLIGCVSLYHLLVMLAPFCLCGSAKALPPPVVTNPQPFTGALMTFLSFSNLTVGESYQMQRTYAWYWTNLPVNFIAANSVYTQLVAGAVQSGDYRLAKNPVPAQAFAVAQIADGSVIGATITAGGSGYITPPVISIVRGGGTNATATASISSSGVVTNITIVNGGTGYTNTPIVKITQPPALAVYPWTQPVMRLNFISDAIGWRLQFATEMGATWQSYGLVTSTQLDLFITNSTGFFRLMYP